MHIRKQHGDIVAALGTLGFSTFLFVEAASMSSRISAYPQLLGTLSGIAGLVLLWRSLRQAKSDELIFNDIAWKPLIACVAVWCSSIPLTVLFGFYPVIGVMIACILWIMEGYPKYGRALIQISGYGVVTATILWLVFEKLLGVITPEGSLF